ncbi:hypothetical protein J3E68DRAFT_78237 [Trichoderma sp. SZMC 28012]
MEAFTNELLRSRHTRRYEWRGDGCQPGDWLGAALADAAASLRCLFFLFSSSSSKREAISWARVREEKDTIYPGCLLRAPGPLPLSNGDERQAFGITERRRIAMEQRAQEELFSS